MIDYGSPQGSKGEDPRPSLSPWRDFSPEEQQLMLRLLRTVKERRGARFEVVMLRSGQIQVAKVERKFLMEVSC